MKKGTEMVCSDCGIPMNRHAEKLLKETSGGDSEETVISIHCCPACGKAASEMRTEEPPEIWQRNE